LFSCGELSFLQGFCLNLHFAMEHKPPGKSSRGSTENEMATRERIDGEEKTTQTLLSAFFAFLCGKDVVGIA